MLNTIISILIFIGMFVFCSITFLLANIDCILEEDIKLENIIEVVPDREGKLFITLYGTRYQIVVKEKPVNKPAKTDK